MQLWSPFSKPSVVRNSGTEVCKAFRQISIRTYDWLDLSRTGRLTPAETSITDLNLFELEQRCARWVRASRYSPGEEKVNGADWQWVFVHRGKSLTVRVQAKKLHPAGRRYAHLDHPADRTKPRQVDELLAKAGAAPAIYCFYNGRWPATIDPQWPTAKACSPTPHSYGCAIASAQEVATLVYARDNRLVSIGPLCRPWSDLVCCPGKSNDPLAALQDLLADLGTNRGPVDAGLPDWARRLIDGDPGAHPDDGDGGLVIDFDGELSPRLPQEWEPDDERDQH